MFYTFFKLGVAASPVCWDMVGLEGVGCSSELTGLGVRFRELLGLAVVASTEAVVTCVVVFVACTRSVPVC